MASKNVSSKWVGGNLIFFDKNNNEICRIDGALSQFAAKCAPSLLTASGAVPVRPSQNYVVTKAGVAALTLAAPTAGTDDGVEVTISSDTANAHTLTATGLLHTGSASVNVATFAAFAGAGLTLMAYNGKWKVLAQIGITFS